MDEITDQQLSMDYDRFTNNYNKIMNELKVVCVTDDTKKRKMLQKKSQILHAIMTQILKLRTFLSDLKNSEV